MCLALLMVLALFFPNKIEAKSYLIDKVSIEAVVNKDGSMEVVENRAYNFSGEFSYAYQYIVKTGKYSDFSICDEEKCYEKIIEDQGNQYYVKWNYKASDEIKNFILKYKVDKAINLHSDIAELYWNFIGDKWEIGQSNIKIKVSLPEGIKDSEIQAWAHGPLDGKVSIPNGREVDFAVPYLGIGKFVEGRIIMPLNIFLDGNIGNLSKQKIIDEENGFINQTRTIQKRQVFVEIIFGLVLIFFMFVQIKQLIRAINNFINYGKDLPLPKVNLSGRLWEPPSNIDPAQVEQLISGYEYLSPRSFTASILSLISDRFYKIERSEKKEGWFVKKYKYYLVKEDNINKKIPSDIQKSVIDFLDEINTIIIDLDDIQKWCSNNKFESQQFFLKTLPKLVVVENIDEGYFDFESEKIRKKNPRLIFVLLGVIPAWIIIFMLRIPVGLFLKRILIINLVVAAICLIIVGILVVKGKKRTQKGLEETAKWLAFQKHLKEYRKTVKSPIDSIIIWEKYLVYGTVLGVSIKALSQLPLNLNENDTRMIGMYWAGSGGNIGESLSSVTSAISSISTSVNSSYGASGVGSSGGFSGGGGGGGSGGGGGAG